MQLMTETKDSRFCELQGFRNHYFYWRMHGNSSTGKLWAGRSESSSDRSDFLSAAAGWRVAGGGRGGSDKQERVASLSDAVTQ